MWEHPAGTEKEDSFTEAVAGIVCSGRELELSNSVSAKEDSASLSLELLSSVLCLAELLTLSEEMLLFVEEVFASAETAILLFCRRQTHIAQQPAE